MTMSGKERKKEQNKLASRRFRQRRKLEQSHTENEAAKLEERNRKLRLGCEQLEARIKTIKEFINQSNNDEDGEEKAAKIKEEN